MIVVEFGNTRVKVAEFAKSTIRSVERFNAHDQNTIIHYITRFLGKHERLAVAASGELPSWFIETFSSLITINVITSDTPTPITNAYDTQETLGIDRLANAVNACSNYPDEAVLVVDLGTCITYNLTVGCEFRGGAISPGISMRVKAMNAFTARLPLVELQENIQLVGTSTQTSLQSGAINGWRAEINGMCEHFKAQFADLRIILTGGDLSYFEAASKSVIFADPFWTLKGYYQIDRFNADV